MTGELPAILKLVDQLLAEPESAEQAQQWLEACSGLPLDDDARAEVTERQNRN